MADKTVYVLGAGFTRAFVLKAPLLVDDYEIPSLCERFKSFEHARAILDAARAQRSDGLVDLERLMTRLTGMPYDTADARRELALLETVLKKSLVQRLEGAKAAGVEWDPLGKFAGLVLAKEASIVTFNYDDVIDEALWRTAETLNPRQPPWNPDGGYGFFCQPSSVCIADSLMIMDLCSTLVLKLHGSINWRSRLGEATPRGPAGLLHHEGWNPLLPRFRPLAHRIEPQLEPDAFIVPPVLVKSELTAHPVLRVVWELAREKLTAATNVVFIGYSLPATDLASQYLFRESLSNWADLDLQIVNWAGDSAEQERVKDTYRSLFLGLPDDRFDFTGARAWVERKVG